MVRAAVAEWQLEGLVARSRAPAAGVRGRCRGWARGRAAPAPSRPRPSAARGRRARSRGGRRRTARARPGRRRAGRPSRRRPTSPAAAGSSACSRSRRQRHGHAPDRSRRRAREWTPARRGPVRPLLAARGPLEASRRPRRRRRPGPHAWRRPSRSLRTSDRVSIPDSAGMPRSRASPSTPGRAPRASTPRAREAVPTRRAGGRRRSCRPSAP